MVDTFENADYPSSYFDVIRFDNVLEHVYDPRAFLSRVYQVLRPGGTAYWYVPNGASPTMQLMRRYSISSWVPFHLSLFAPSCLRTLAESVGFYAKVVSLANPGWVALSVVQYLNRRLPGFHVRTQCWSARGTILFAAPLWWLFNKIWQGEELVLIARKPSSTAPDN